MAKGILDVLFDNICHPVESSTLVGRSTLGSPLLRVKGGGSRGTVERDFANIRTMITIRRVGREIAADKEKQE